MESTSCTLPAVVSAALAEYVVARDVVIENVPVPNVDQIPLPVEEDPLSDATGLLRQISWFAPAFALGASVMVTIMESLTARQVPFPVVVRYIFTLPAAVSAALGV